uniref:Uncharacterized protein n=1 Tax=Rhizophora mucronata TaxID=61149 RepID=A0A2P2N4T5_RHIMU
MINSIFPLRSCILATKSIWRDIMNRIVSSTTPTPMALFG